MYITRLKYWVGNNWMFLSVVLFTLFIVSAGIAVSTYTNPPVEVIETTEDEQRISIATSSSAVVNEENELYEKGEVLENRPVYFSQLVDNISYHTHVTAPIETETEVEAKSELMLVGETTDGEQFWSTVRPLSSSTATIVRTEQKVHTVKLNITEIQSELGEKKSDLNGRGVFSTTLRTTVEYDTGQYTNTEQLTSELSADGNQIRIQQPSATQTHADTQIIRTERDPINQRLVAFVLAGIILMILLASTVIYGPRIDTDKLQYDIEHIQYAEWISEGEIPTSPDREPVKIDNLSDLVNTAIDMNGRVIYNDTYNVYGVITDDILYYVCQEKDSIKEWFDVEHPEIDNQGSSHLKDESGMQYADEQRAQQDDNHLELFDKDVTTEDEIENQSKNKSDISYADEQKTQKDDSHLELFDKDDTAENETEHEPEDGHEPDVEREPEPEHEPEDGEEPTDGHEPEDEHESEPQDEDDIQR